MRREDGKVVFPDGVERTVPGYWERLDILRGAEIIIPHPVLSREIWVPDPVDGYRFRQTAGDNCSAEAK